MNPARGKVLLISQVFPPDTAAVGQYLEDAAAELGRRGWTVRVLTADRGYDDPSERFPARQVTGGVEVSRLRWSSFGKRSMAVRLLGMACFLTQALLRGILMPGVGAVLVSTSPPMAGIVGWAVARLRRVPLVYWVMDINPDQAVASGRAQAGSLRVKAFENANRRVLHGAASVVVLDRFMRQRLEGKRAGIQRLEVIAPWPLERFLAPVPREGNAFRRQHGLEGRFVVMYSGNHSLVHPLDTALEAARRLRGNPRIRFVFVGGGVGKQAIERAAREEGLENVLLLPYQRLEDIRFSLSAADVHLVSMGDAMVGLVHPSKFYGALEVRRPVILLGPEVCHVTDVFARFDCGWRVAHGDAEGLVALVRRLSESASEAVLEAKGRAAGEALSAGLNAASLRAAWADEFERAAMTPR